MAYTPQRVHLRYTHPDGSSKDWVGELHPDGTVLRMWGKTGCKMQSSTAPPSKTAPDARRFFDDCVTSKLKKGYQYVNTTDSAEIKERLKKQEAEARAEKRLESLQEEVSEVEGLVLF